MGSGDFLPFDKVTYLCQYTNVDICASYTNVDTVPCRYTNVDIHVLDDKISMRTHKHA